MDEADEKDTPQVASTPQKRQTPEEPLSGQSPEGQDPTPKKAARIMVGTCVETASLLGSVLVKASMTNVKSVKAEVWINTGTKLSIANLSEDKQIEFGSWYVGLWLWRQR